MSDQLFIDSQCQNWNIDQDLANTDLHVLSLNKSLLTIPLGLKVDEHHNSPQIMLYMMHSQFASFPIPKEVVGAE